MSPNSKSASRQLEVAGQLVSATDALLHSGIGRDATVYGILSYGYGHAWHEYNPSPPPPLLGVAFGGPPYPQNQRCLR